MKPIPQKVTVPLVEMYLQQGVMNGINDVWKDMDLDGAKFDDVVWYELVIKTLKDELANYETIHASALEGRMILHESAILYFPAPINELYREMDISQATTDAILTFFAMAGETKLSNELWREFILHPMLDEVFETRKQAERTWAGYTAQQLYNLDLYTLKAIAAELMIDTTWCTNKRSLVEAITV